MSKEIKVSVCVVTYNHERYIAECLDSLVSQVTDFNFEIIIGEDKSTDNTREIVESFHLKYPALIRPIYNSENVGAVENAKRLYRAARGEYICHIDGDDGALPGKLQNIVNLFAAFPRVVMVTHDMVIKDADSKHVANSLSQFKSGIYDINDLVRNLPFFTNSAKSVRRAACIASLDFLHDMAIDVELHLLEAQYGKIYHIDSAYGYYRVFTGVSSQGGRVNQAIVNGYVRAFDGLMAGNYNNVNLSTRELASLYAFAFLKFSYQSLYFGNGGDSRRYAIQSLKIKVFSGKQFLLYFMSCLGPISTALVKYRSRPRKQ